MNLLRKIATLSIVSFLHVSCISHYLMSTDVVYTYSNGHVTDRNKQVVFNYANGSVTKYIPANADKPIQINKDLEILRLTNNCFLYTAWADMGRWGRIGSNGLVVVNKGKAFLIDSPTLESQTVELAWWFDKNLDVKFESFVPGHWHDDCVGGMAWLNRNGVKTYAYDKTNHLLASKGMAQAKESFQDSTTLFVGNTAIQLYFLGGGHATDNIVAWIPSEKILFGGCMVKDTGATNIGNTSDAAPLNEWLQTIERVEQKFPDATLIIPGHGKAGDKELLTHTKKIIEKELEGG